MTTIQAGFDFYKDIPGYKAIFKAVLKNVIQILVEQLSEQTNEESVLLTASVTDGTLSHLGSESGRYFLEGHDEIKSQFLGFCLKRHHKRKSQETLQVPQPKRFASASHSIPDLTSLSSENDMYSTNVIPNLSDFSSMVTAHSHSNQLPALTSGLTGHISLTGHNARLSSQSPGITGHVGRTEKPKIHPISLTKVKRKQQSPLHRSRLAVESVSMGSDIETVDKKVDKVKDTGVGKTISDRLQTHETPNDGGGVNTESVSNSAGHIVSVLGSESHIRIKTETPDFDEMSKADTEEVNMKQGLVSEEKQIARSELTQDEAAEGVDGQNEDVSSKTIKVEALEEESDLEITGVEGEMNDSTGSFGGFGSGYNDGQMYSQDLSGMEGQRSNLEGQQYKSKDSPNIPTPSLTTTKTVNATPSQQNAEGRPFKCPDCPKTFKVRRHLQVHYRIHSGVRPYECKECGLTFNQQGPLQTHRRRHTGERPYQCDICKDRFMRKDSMLAHKRKHFTLRTLLENKFPKHLK